MASDSSYLFHALGQLDRVLEAARHLAESAYGEGAAADPYRGFCVSPADFGRLLGRPAGEPLLWSSNMKTSLSGPLEVLQRVFALDSFELDALLIALAPEIDLRYQRLYAYLQDDVTCRRPSVDLVLNLLCPTVEAKLEARHYFDPRSRLVGSQVLRVGSNSNEAAASMLARAIHVEDSVVSFLLGRAELDQRLHHFCSFRKPNPTDGDAGTLTRAAILLAEQTAESGNPARFYFQGPRGSGRKEAAAAVAAALGLGLLRADLGTCGTHVDRPMAADLLRRDMRLLDALLYLDNADTLLASQETGALDVLITRALKNPGVVVIAGEAPWASLQQRLGAFGSNVVTLRFGLPNFRRRAECWKASLERNGLAADPAVVESLASRFQLTEGQIQAAAGSAEGQARFRAVVEDGFTVPIGRDLFAAARAQSDHNLGSLARKITPRYQWKDLILPEDPLAQLAELCNQAQHRQLVYGNWGFDQKLSLGKGLSVLFAGPPGAGKTMAAEVMAAELELDLFKIDLSQIVNKYIGETEKNLNRVFEEARASNAILFFDEADALFGKRSEVRDSHDRYANIEIAYLLQKMEEYDGVSCLATNLKKHLDEAFTRRLSFIIDFPFPDEESRLRIWRSIWPDDIPLSDDLDLGYVARKFRLSGGSIKNVAVAAAFLAAGEGERVRTEHLVRATQREYQKMGKSLSQIELGSYGRIRAVAAGGSGS